MNAPHASRGSKVLQSRMHSHCALLLAGDVLAVRVLLPRPFELTLKHKFVPRQWYHVVVAHSMGGTLSPSTVSLFVNGILEAHAKFRYPRVRLPHAYASGFWHHACRLSHLQCHQSALLCLSIIMRSHLKPLDLAAMSHPNWYLMHHLFLHLDSCSPSSPCTGRNGHEMVAQAA